MLCFNKKFLFTVCLVFTFVGCGGGSSSKSSTSSTTSSVSVTKGPLLMATARDAKGKIGTQVNNSNVYEFEDDVTYPITVTGGYVDVNNNGIVDSGDYEFTGKLTSYSKVVTPVTTYLGDPDDSDYESKLETLKTLTGASTEDLTEKDPSETSAEVIALVASVYTTYSNLMDTNDENDNTSDISTEDLESSYENYENVISSTGSEDLETIFQAVEEQIKTDNDVEELTDDEIAKLNFTKDNVVGNKLDAGTGETYYFRENDIVIGDSGDDYTKTASYGDFSDGVLNVIIDDTTYNLITATSTGFDISFYENSSLLETISITSELTEYTTSELGSVLSDVMFELTEAMFVGKTIVAEDNIGTSALSFYSNGAYTSSWDDSKSGGDSGTCEGTWQLDSSITNRINIEEVCSDNSNGTITTYLEFDETPAVNTTIDTTSGSSDKATLTIVSISTGNEEISIENTFGTDSLKNQTLYYVWYGSVQDEDGDTVADNVPAIEKIIVQEDGSGVVTGLLNSTINVNGYIGVKDNKLYTGLSSAEFDETSYNEYLSGSLATGCIKTQYIDTVDSDENNIDLIFTDENVAIGFASLLTDTISGCPSSSSDYISIENSFGDDIIKGQTIYAVYFGMGLDSNGDDINDVAVVEKHVISNDGSDTMTGLLNYEDATGVVGVYENKIYVRGSSEYKFSADEYIEYESGSLSDGCILVNYYEGGQLDNKEVIFSDETAAMNFANSLSSEVTACPSN